MITNSFYLCGFLKSLLHFELYKPGPLMGVCYLSSHEVVMTGGLQKSWTHSCPNDPLGKVRYLLRGSEGGGTKSMPFVELLLCGVD